jgi:hypothetical protein
MDSREFAITCERHYGKIALYKSKSGLLAQQCAMAA